MKNSGKRVRTKKGLEGIVYNDSKIINNKVAVYLDDKIQMLCDPNTLTIIGYVN